MSPPSASLPSLNVLLPPATALHIHCEHDSAEARRDIPQPSSASIGARRAAWSRLWQILLREPANDDVEQQGAEPSSEFAKTNNAAARATSELEVTMSE